MTFYDTLANRHYNLDRQVALSDGRILGFAEGGWPDGMPVVLLHGLPGSRLCATPLSSQAEEMGLRWIAPDRPGFGISTLQPHRTISGWATDLTELLDSLSLSTVSLIGVSAGGPFALACAALAPERLQGLSIVSGLGSLRSADSTAGMVPLFRCFWRSARDHPRLTTAFLRACCPLLRRLPLRTFFRTMDADSRRILAEFPAVAKSLTVDIREALRQGGRAFASEAALLARPWDFRLEEVQVEAHFWHGSADRTCPLEMARQTTSSLPSGRLHVAEGEGHLMAFRHIAEILGSVCEHC